MNPKLSLCALFLLCASVVLAHDNWLIVEYPLSVSQSLAKVQICSGHGFPESELLIAERLLVEMEVTGPDGKSVPYKVTAQDKKWTADVMFDKPGVWVVSFALKKPQAAEPLYRGRNLVVVGRSDDTLRYACKKGLEIVPGSALSALKAGDMLPLSITLDGAPLEGTISVTPEKGSASFLSTGKDRPAQLKIASSGMYLLTASNGGKTFSLTFAAAK